MAQSVEKSVSCPCLAESHGFDPGIYLLLFINTEYIVINDFSFLLCFFFLFINNSSTEKHKKHKFYRMLIS